VIKRTRLYYLRVNIAPHQGLIAYAMVPVYVYAPTDELARGDVLRLASELYPHLPVERFTVLRLDELDEDEP
jgi:hypothetical protein